VYTPLPATSPPPPIRNDPPPTSVTSIATKKKKQQEAKQATIRYMYMLFTHDPVRLNNDPCGVIYDIAGLLNDPSRFKINEKPCLFAFKFVPYLKKPAAAPLL